MSKIKSDKVKKLEAELGDLQNWLDLGLVPNKDLVKHKEEIAALQKRIEEERGKLTESKDGNEPEEYIAPKRTQAKQPFSESTNISDVDVDNSSVEEDEEEEDSSSPSDGFITDDDDDEDEDEDDVIDVDEDDPFSDRNRWRRGVLEDPDADNW